MDAFKTTRNWVDSRWSYVEPCTSLWLKLELQRECIKSLHQFPDAARHHKFKRFDPFWHLMTFIKRARSFPTRDIIPRWKLTHFCGFFPGIYLNPRHPVPRERNLWMNYELLTCGWYGEKVSWMDQPQIFALSSRPLINIILILNKARYTSSGKKKAISFAYFVHDRNCFAFWWKHSIASDGSCVGVRSRKLWKF